MCQHIGDDDILGEQVLREDQPEEERTNGASEEVQLESKAPDPSSDSGATGPPSPLTPTDVSP